MEYLACRQIFNFINFSKDGISFCCDESRGNVPYLPIDDNKLKVDDFLDFRLKTIAQFKCGQMPCPPTCEHLNMQDWSKYAESMFGVISINNFTACNCDCYYCSVKNKGISKYKPIDYLKEFARRGYLFDKCVFSWGGGEVSLYQGFKEELELSMYYNFKNVMHTSGIIVSPLIAKALNKTDSHLTISPDSGTPETYLKVKGVDKFNEVKNSIKIYAKCGSPLALKYIVNEYNCTIDDLKGFVELCKISPNIIALVSLTAAATASKKYDEKHFLHLYWLIQMLKAENIVVEFFSPFFLDDAINEFAKFCNSPKYEKLRNLYQG